VRFVWACFAVRLLFYSAMLPLWEGYDEWAHFAVIQRMAVHGELLVSRDAPVARDVEASLQLAPVPWELRTLAPPSLTEDAYWTASREERGRRESAMRAIPARWGAEDGAGTFTAYEALQPPLYYWIMAPVLWICRTLGASLAGQVLALRFLGSLLASLVIPLVFQIGRLLWGDDRVALGCAAIVAVMPGLALDVARVGNDCLAVVLFTALTWLALKTVQQGFTVRLAVQLGVVLGLGLLTKAYFLTAIPAVVAALVYGWWRKRNAAPIFLTGATALLLSGWWYARNLRTTGTLSGLSESLMLRRAGAGEMLRQAAGIHWAKAIDTIFFSHLYFGGWSSLTVRSWIYHAFYAAIVLGMAGLWRALRQPPVVTLLVIYLSFWMGQIYNVILLYMSKGLAGSMGWYMYAVVGAEVILSVAGLLLLLPARMSAWVTAAGAAMFALLDLYTVQGVAIPYYTGMIQHRANGSLGALHWAGFQNVGIAGTVERLTAFKSAVVPVPLLLLLWLLYLAGTAGGLAAACARKCDSAANIQG
jgi:4-amino-4-deoxy-L-arabinose transferase-like glycosyltransferase